MRDDDDNDPESARPLKGPVVSMALVGLFLLAVLIYQCSQNLNRGFWYDECFTMLRFVNPGIKTICTEYEPNNHLLFSVLIWSYTSPLRLNEPLAFVQNPIPVRLFTGILASNAFLAFGWVGWKHRKTAVLPILLSIAFLVACIPFWNFFFQLRGYGFSIGLLSWLMVLVLDSMWTECKSTQRCVFVGLTTAALIYTIPANVYFIASIWIPLSVLATIQFLQDRNAPYLRLAIAMAGGGLLAVLLCMPVLFQILYSPYANSQGYFQSAFDSERFARFFQLLVNGRVWIYLIAMIGWVMSFCFSDKDRRKFCLKTFLFVLSLLILPFFLVGIHGTQPFGRNYTPIIPAAMLFLGFGIWGAIDSALSRVPDVKRKLFSSILCSVMIVFCAFSFIADEHKRKSILQTDLENGSRSQNIFANYYQHRFNPQQTIEDVKSLLEKSDNGSLENDTKSIVASQLSDIESIRYYCLAHGIEMKFESDHAPNGIYVTGQTQRVLAGDHSPLPLNRFKIKELLETSRRNDFHAILIVERISQPNSD